MTQFECTAYSANPWHYPCDVKFSVDGPEAWLLFSALAVSLLVLVARATRS